MLGKLELRKVKVDENFPKDLRPPHPSFQLVVIHDILSLGHNEVAYPEAWTSGS